MRGLPHRVRTLRKGDFTLWADRVDAMHGQVTLFTLWKRDGAKNMRLIGGVTLRQLREFARGAAV